MPTYTFVFENGETITIEDENIFKAWQQRGLPGEEFERLEFCRETNERGSDIIGAAKFEEDFYAWLQARPEYPPF